MDRYWLSHERNLVILNHGVSYKEVIGGNRGNNVLAVVGPAGVGKSLVAALVMKEYPGEVVCAEKWSARRPTPLEMTGEMPYKYMSVWDMALSEKPLLCSRNVDFGPAQQERWEHWYKVLRLEEKGIVLPDVYEAISCAHAFINCYFLDNVVEMQREAEALGQTMIIETSEDQEKYWAAIFPGMSVVRVFTSKMERVKRILERHRPSSDEEWLIASLKILDSLTTATGMDRSTRTCLLQRNETQDDVRRLVRLIGDLHQRPPFRAEKPRAVRKVAPRQLVCA